MSLSNGVICQCFMQLCWATALSAALHQTKFLSWWVGKHYGKKPWTIVSFRTAVASFFLLLSSTCPQWNFKEFWVKSSGNYDCLVERPSLFIRRWMPRAPSWGEMFSLSQWAGRCWLIFTLAAGRWSRLLPGAGVGGGSQPYSCAVGLRFSVTGQTCS